MKTRKETIRAMYRGVKTFTVTNPSMNAAMKVEIDFRKADLPWKLRCVMNIQHDTWQQDIDSEYGGDIIKMFLSLLGREAFNYALEGWDTSGVRMMLEGTRWGGMNGEYGVRLLDVQASINQTVDVIMHGKIQVAL